MRMGQMPAARDCQRVLGSRFRFRMKGSPYLYAFLPLYTMTANLIRKTVGALKDHSATAPLFTPSRMRDK